MKKIISFVLALILLLSFASCKKESPQDTTPPTYEIKKHTEDVIWEGKDHGDIILLYPVLSLDNKVNELIFSIVEKNCNDTIPNLSSYDDGNLPELTYEITSFNITYLSSTMLSANVEGILTVSLAAHPSLFVYTLNLDLEEIREITSSEIIGSFDKIKELFKNGDFTLERGADGLLSETNFEDMIMQYRSEYEIYPMVCLSNEKLYMNIELVYALGSNALFSIDLEEVKKFLNTDNKEISKIIDQRK